MSQRINKASGRILRPVQLLLVFLLVAAMLVYLSLMNQIHTKLSSSSSSSSSPYGNNAASASSSAGIQQLQDRIQYLETKVDSYLAYAKDPFLSNKAPAKCQHRMQIKDIACPDKTKRCELDNSSICMDDFPYVIDANNKKKKCVVYDFGIRESPEYGLAFTQQCDVVGFDPSPISIKWWKAKQFDVKKKHPTYQFLGVGAGGIDGEIQLREYDWGQVSIVEFPRRVFNTTDCNSNGMCKYTFYDQQKSFPIPVRTLQSLMKQLGHDRVHLLKLDVEGSEYAFLEKMIDNLSCRKVDQLSLEWHHYDYDVRYGVSSNPQINVLVALLKERCGLEQYWVHESKGWPSNSKMYAEMGMTLYYSLSSFKRTTWKY